MRVMRPSEFARSRAPTCRSLGAARRAALRARAASGEGGDSEPGVSALTLEQRKQAIDAKAAKAEANQAMLADELAQAEARFQELDRSLAEAKLALREQARVVGVVEKLPERFFTEEALRRPAEEPVASAPEPPELGGTEVRRPFGALGSLFEARPAEVEVVEPAAADVAKGARGLFGSLFAGIAAATVAQMRSPAAKRAERRAELLRLKSELLLLVAPLERGAAAGPEQEAQVLAAVQQLEALNPTARPMMSSFSDGRWNVVYTSSVQMLGLNKPAVLRPTGPLYVSFNAEDSIAEIECTWPKSREFARTSMPTTSSVQLQFEQVKVFGIPLPTNATREYSFLDTVFLDAEMRICRGGNETIYVLIQDDPTYKIGKKATRALPKSS